MNNNEANDILESLFPVGQERWIKVKYLDLKKCINAFHPYAKESREKDLGYETTAIGVRDDYTPQVSALMDIRDDITTLLLNNGVEGYILDSVRNILKNKIEEVKERTINNF